MNITAYRVIRWSGLSAILAGIFLSSSRQFIRLNFYHPLPQRPGPSSIT